MKVENNSKTKKYKSFFYHSFEILSDENKIIFEYSFDKKVYFYPEMELDLSTVQNKKDIELAVFNLGMSMLIGYYKAYCSHEIIIEAGFLDDEQVKFWEKLYRNGLMQFFYENDIDFKDLINVKSISDKKFSSINDNEDEKVLLPIGGGKDSLVSAEILKEKNIDFTWFYIEQHDNLNERINKLINISGNSKKITLKNNTEKNYKKIIELNKKDALNGHVPITSIYIFSAVLTAVIHGFSKIDFSNEKSADEENTKFCGEKVFHAYSKSNEFEKDVAKYIKRNISKNIDLKSLLRNYSGVEVIEKFANCPQYFDTFISCNPGLKTGKWCGKCPKCAYVFLGLSAFLDKEVVLRIFKKNLFEDKKLENLFKELIGERDIKPLDCVGTIAENRQLYELAKKNWNEETKTSQNKIAIAGFGVEGRALYEYFKSKGDYEIHIFDERNVEVPNDTKFHLGLSIPAEFEVCYKSQGISSLKMKLESKKTKIETLTNLILENIKGKVVGITGTVGKTTVSSLIYFILKENSFDVELIGNIGNVDLLSIMKTDNSKKLYIFEMSSYQCEYLKKSPPIAVILNVFPAHIKQHGSLEKYKEAKMNIAKFQNEGDYLLTPEEIEKSDKKFQTKLLGEHNQKNCFVAYEVCKKIGLSDEMILPYIAKFQPVDKRLEKVTVKNEIIFYDDAMSSLPISTMAAVNSLQNVDTIILGGADNDISYKDFANFLAKSTITNFIIFPGIGEEMVKEAKKDKNKNVLKASNMMEAVQLSFEYTQKNKICLLSTAAPSFGMFKDYKDKSRQYINYIENF